MTQRDREAPEGADAMTHVDEDPGGSEDAMTHPDAELSALLDGALDPEAAAALRARLAAEPALAERLARLGEVDGRLRRLAADAVPDPARLARLRAGVQARIDAAAERPPAPDRAAGGVVHALRPRARRVAWVAAALAAGLALYVLAPRPVPVDPPRVAGDPGAAPPLPTDPLPRRGSVLDQPLAAAASEAERSDGAPAPDAGARPPAPEAVTSADALALAPESVAGPGSDEPREPVELAASGDPVAPGADAADAAEEGAAPDPVLGVASDAELAVAVRYEVLTDLEVIENLEVLEMLAMLDTTESL